ncbi:MAG: 30S ribosomal protein S6 [Magnetospirillum sp.]|nr:30S ribosomal protein S6 [Magnetospirillum sp.]
MPLYECVILARQEVSAPQVETLADEMANVIAQGGGQVTKKEYWGLRNLAYRVKKNRKAHYVLFNVDSPSPAVKEMERQMSLNEDILRYLTVRVEELEEGPSAMMQSKSDREGRGERGERPRRDFRDDRGERPRRSEGGE